MKIFSNDYQSSIPGSGIMAHGGPPRFAINFSGYLAKKCHDWQGLVFKGGSDIEVASFKRLYSKQRKTLFELSVPTKSIHSVTHAKRRLSSRRLLVKEISLVKEVLEEQKPDLVFLNGFSVTAWILFEAARQSHLPVAIQHAGIFAREIREYADRFSPAGRQICYQMERDTTKYAEVNIFLNRFSRDTLVKLLRVSKIKGEVIVPLPRPDWLDRRAPKVLGPRRSLESGLIIGVIARWDRIKNHPAILELAEEIKRTKLPWQIKSITKIPDGSANRLFKDKYKRAIKVLPLVNSGGLQKFLGSIDLLIVPSRFDVSPTVVMESVVCDTPALISPQVGWVSEYERAGAGKWIIDFNRPNQVIKRIETLFQRQNWPALVKFRQVVRDKHDPEKVYRRYLDLFKQAVV
ncbi:MAG: glycosyltransferase [Patescibacteria group bacterium]|nr:glycosyltransferase [Patescibacteria group bacterium]